jgi:hypothetical protein
MKVRTLPYRPPTPREYAADKAIHAVGLLAALVGIALLFALAGGNSDWAELLSTSI